MYHLRLIAVLLPAMLASFIPVGSAAIITNTIYFGSPLEVSDLASGNDSNFMFTHYFAELDLKNSEILNSELSVKHDGNTNIGPTRELWSIFSADNLLLGKLSESLAGPIVDTFTLPLDYFEDITLEEFSGFKIHLAEMTSFNREKINLYSSEMTIEYAPIPRNDKIPVSPEPACLTLAAILLGIAGSKLKKKK